MNFLELQNMARTYVPGAKASVLDPDILKTMLNRGALDVCSYTGCLKKNEKFTVTAEVQEYSITSKFSKYLNIDKKGIWVYDGTQWKQMIPKTVKWLDENEPAWRNAASDLPMYYYIEGDNIGFHPMPETTRDLGAWIYYTRRHTQMSDDGHYPFHAENDQTTEIPWLSILDDSILEYVEWKLYKPVSKETVEVDDKQKVYYINLDQRMKQINNRPDISMSHDNRAVGRMYR